MVRFNPAPGWPMPPANWLPRESWRPDPSWAPAPASWVYYLDEYGRPASAPPGTWRPPGAVPFAQDWGRPARCGWTGFDLTWVLALGLIAASISQFVALRLDQQLWSWANEANAAGWLADPNLSQLIALPLYWSLVTAPAIAAGIITGRRGSITAAGVLSLIAGACIAQLMGEEPISFLYFTGVGIVLSIIAAEVLMAVNPRRQGLMSLAMPALGVSIGQLLFTVLKLTAVGPYSGWGAWLMETPVISAGALLILVPWSFLTCGLLPAAIGLAVRPPAARRAPAATHSFIA